MEEIDLLKKHWKEQSNNMPKIPAEQLQKIINKKSSSIVRWLFIVSVAEFIFWILLSIWASSEESLNLSNLKIAPKLDLFAQGLELISCGVVIYFIVMFYKMYRKINVADSVTMLMKTILKTRQITKQYIIFNIVINAVLFLLGIFIGIEYELKKYNGFEHLQYIFQILFALIMIFLILIFILLIWLFYKLIYGWLIKRLEKNYQELNKM